MPAPPAMLPLFWGSGRGRGRRDMRWHRRMSFLSRCTAALEWSLGEEVLEPGLTEKCTSPMWRASAWARACGGGERENKTGSERQPRSSQVSNQAFPNSAMPWHIYTHINDKTTYTPLDY